MNTKRNVENLRIALAVIAALAALILYFLFGISSTRAATLEREYQALMQAQRTLKTEVGCSDTSAAFATPYTVGKITKYGNPKTDAITITGYGIRVTCTGYLPSPPTPTSPPVVVDPPDTGGGSTPIPTSVKLTWTHPTSRADGSALAVTDIQGYKIFEIVGTAKTEKELAYIEPLTTYTATGLAPGVHVFGVRTVDKKGLTSSLSTTFSVELK